MQFNSETNGLDLYSDARFLCGLDETSDTTSYPIKAFTRNANFGLDRVNALVLRANGWNIPFDDGNQTGELLDTSNNLVSGTQKTSLGATWLKIARVRIKDASGNWMTLYELARKAQTDSQLNAPSGTPTSYYIVGNYLYFDKAPDYSSTGGLEVQFQRGASYFAYTDTTKSPGFAPQFHRLISCYGARDYCMINDMNGKLGNIKEMIGTPPDLMNGEPGSGMEKELCDFYSQRDTDAPPSLNLQNTDYGELGLSNGTGTYPNRSPRGF
jgi:hypothetical protein